MDQQIMPEVPEGQPYPVINLENIPDAGAFTVIYPDVTRSDETLSETVSKAINEDAPLTCGRCNSQDVKVYDGVNEADIAIIVCDFCGFRERM